MLTKVQYSLIVFHIAKNRVDVLSIPARDVFSYGQLLLDVFFTREVLSNSLVYKSSKSDKPGMDTDRVKTIFCEDPFVSINPQNKTVAHTL